MEEAEPKVVLLIVLGENTLGHLRHPGTPATPSVYTTVTSEVEQWKELVGDLYPEDAANRIPRGFVAPEESDAGRSTVEDLELTPCRTKNIKKQISIYNAFTKAFVKSLVKVPQVKLVAHFKTTDSDRVTDPSRVDPVWTPDSDRVTDPGRSTRFGIQKSLFPLACYRICLINVMITITYPKTLLIMCLMDEDSHIVDLLPMETPDSQSATSTVIDLVSDEEIDELLQDKIHKIDAKIELARANRKVAVFIPRVM
ncbi:hypothetical protein RND71_001752 [Anisodus tanguticus]|uniref:Uncharacterized protein n=1 Tax=Anisodus tanguticus TaxID=243964 RepID=A0AAE1T0S5_9SOLA|nr:hypothetical protein RND71_001752 [Anisodus tanguticus]